MDCAYRGIRPVTNQREAEKEMKMKTAIIRACASLGLGAALGLSLMAQGPTKVTIPFDFTVGSKSFSAGEYTVRTDVAQSVLAIQSADHRAAIMALTRDVRSTKPVS